MKRRKWYSTINNKPDKSHGLIIMTDMGYIFEAVYQDGQFLVSNVKDHKVYFEPFDNQSIIKFMKI